MARVSRAQAVTACRVNGDGIDYTDVSEALRGMAFGVQSALQTVRKSALHKYPVGHPLMMKAWYIDSCLRLHTKPHPVQDAKKHSGNNPKAARRTDHEAEFAVPQKNCRHH